MFQKFEKMVRTTRINMPRYSQIPNGCGLNTFLMLINPERNENFKNFLNKVYSNISFLTSSFKQYHKRLEEYKWAIVLSYLLLKTYGNKDKTISDFLNDKFPDVFQTYRVIAVFQLKNTMSRRFISVSKKSSLSYFYSFLVNPHVLRKHAFSMRTDVDLKILFALFGGKFIPQNQAINDGTGSLYFTRADFRSGESVIKIKLMQDHLANQGDDGVPCIALNMGYHWVPVRVMNQACISRNIPESHRFYFFLYNPQKAFIFNEKFTCFLNKEVKKESS